MNSQNNSIAIIGANGQVGTALSVLLKEKGNSVFPVVRNRIAASTFESLGFDYRIGEITNNNDAPELVENADIIVIAAFVPWFYSMPPRSARKTNKSIVKNAVRYADEDTEIIYFSTIVAFGEQIGLSNWNWYGREKRRTENDFTKYCDKYNQDGYIFRLGHVYGPTQEHTREFERAISSQRRLYFPVSADEKSNIIHISALSNSILTCTSKSVHPGTYGVVNQPQWTWKEVVERYGKNTKVQFKPNLLGNDRQKGILRRLTGYSVQTLKPYKELLISPLHYVPDQISSYLNSTRNEEEISESLKNYGDRLVYDHRHLYYKPAPEPCLDVKIMNPNAAEKTVRDHLLR